jgi:hypothetical protein
MKDSFSESEVIEIVSHVLSETKLVEAVISKVATSFPPATKSGFDDSHMPIAPFGDSWGRGAISSNRIAAVGGYGASHQELKRRLPDAEMTFYWGYDPSTQTLHFTTASIKGTGFTNQKLKVIVNELLTKGPLRRGFIWKVGKA